MLVVCPACTAANRVPAERATQEPNCGRCGRALLDGRPVELGESNFDAVSARTELPLVVDFWADWCGPCKAMAPQFERAAAQLKGQAIFAKVDSDANPRLSVRFRVRSIPTIVLLDRGEEKRRRSGALGEKQIVDWVRGG